MKTNTYPRYSATQIDPLLDLQEVRAMVGGVSRVSIYNWMNAGTFPKARKIGPRRVGWLASEIVAFINARSVT
jgi:prophage regulatory protein